MGLNGIPVGAQVDMSYRTQSEVFYLLPNGTSMSDYNDLDKTYMQPYEKDERIVVGADASGAPLYVREVLNPSLQFSDRDIMYTHLVMHDGYASYYDINGTILTSVPLGDSTRIGSPPNDSGDGLIPGQDFVKIGTGKFKLTTPEFEVTLDTILRTIFMEEFDANGVWLVRNFLQMDQTDAQNHTPVYRMQAERITTPSGDCVFKILQEKNSEFYNVNNPSLRESEKIVKNMFFNEVEVYPNPATDRVWVELPKGFTLHPEESISFNLYSMNGQLLKSSEISSSRILELQTIGLQPGMYIITLRHNGAMWSDNLIIK